MQFHGNFPRNLTCGKPIKSFCLHINAHISNYLVGKTSIVINNNNG